MKKRLFLYLFFIIHFSVSANDILKDVSDLEQTYHRSLQTGQYHNALQAALSLNAIDPANTEFLLYVVLASIKADTTIPSWVMAHPWSNATNQEKFNRLLAEQLITSSLESPKIN
jgi:hypothetical protein